MIYERFAPTLCQGSQRTFFFLVHFTCCSKPDKNLHKDNFQKTYSQSFSTTLHILLRYYTIHTNVCIVHYKMWFLCKVWFPYQTALEIQRICEDIFNDINTYNLVHTYVDIVCICIVNASCNHREIQTPYFFPLEIIVSIAV